MLLRLKYKCKDEFIYIYCLDLLRIAEKVRKLARKTRVLQRYIIIVSIVRTTLISIVTMHA